MYVVIACGDEGDNFGGVWSVSEGCELVLIIVVEGNDKWCLEGGMVRIV